MAPPPAAESTGPTVPPGIVPMFLRGVTAEKYGMKTGENVMDLVEYIWLDKEEVEKEIITLGVMSDFDCAKKQIKECEKILIVIDKEQKYGEVFLLYYTQEVQDEFMNERNAIEEAIAAQKRAEEEAAAAAEAAALARLTVEYEDKPIEPRKWESTTSGDTEAEIKLAGALPPCEKMALQVTRPKRSTKMKVKLTERDAEVGGVLEIRSHKDLNFKMLRESENGFQSAPEFSCATAQTTWYRSVNKAVQYEAIGIHGTNSNRTSTGTSTSTGTGPDAEPDLLSTIVANNELKDGLVSFLERATPRIERSLQQNETVDIFQETFQTKPDDDQLEGGIGGAHADNSLRELKNFADPTYSKFKSLPAIDWMPKSQGMVAVSAVRNLTFEQRVRVMGETYSAYIMLWDFKYLVRPQVLMQCEHELFTFKFNSKNNNIVAGGSVSGQVLLWDLREAMELIASRSRRSGADEADEDETTSAPIVAPRYVSSIDYCHKRPITDIFWLPPNIQINYRGHIVGDSHLDGESHQFVSIATDGQVMVWDTRYEKIALDEVKHVGRAKHVPMEKVSNKESEAAKDKEKEKAENKADENANAHTASETNSAIPPVASSTQHFKPIWTPIFKAHLKRVDGVGELSLCKVSYTGAMNTDYLHEQALKAHADSKSKANPPPPGDPRSQLLLATEEGDLMLADLCATKGASSSKGDEGDDEDGEGGREFVKWITKDHTRPSVALQVSPFFPEYVLSISDWGFHIFRIGSDTPVFSSPVSSICFTGGAWSPTRPAVLFVTTSDGHILAWDFTDSSYRPSIELNVTHTKITSMEFLVNAGAAAAAAGSRQQLVAIGDESGTLHIFEIPRNLSRPTHKEENSMSAFLDREFKVSFLLICAYINVMVVCTMSLSLCS